MSGYIGNIPVPQATQTRQTFTATASQTTFNTIGYTPRFLDVFLNGVKLVNGTDYTATNGSDVVLTTGAASGDTLEVVAFNAFDAVSQNFTDGITVENNGATVITADRQTSDGTIIDLQKNGSTVGSIGTASNIIFAGGGDAFLGFDSTFNLIKPASTSSGGASDGLLDLGGTTRRFKDLYLSGGVYLGGTGSANKLDDYETGTWTATLSDAASGGNTTATDTSAVYTKIGRQVHFLFEFPGNVNVSGMTSTGTLTIQGLPFTTSSLNEGRSGDVELRLVTYSSGNVPILVVGTSRNYIYFIETAQSSSFNPLEVSEFSNGDSIYAQGSYFVD